MSDKAEQPAGAPREAAPLSRRAIIVVALKRSGHHAFVDWILTHSHGAAIFLNSARPGLEFRSKTGSAIFKPSAAASPERVSVEKAGRIAAVTGTQIVVLNYENRFIENVVAHGWPQGSAAETFNISRFLFLRDPLNNFASVIKRVRNGRLSARDAQLGKTALLFHEYATVVTDQPGDGGPIEPVHFDDWLRLPSHREELATKLGLRGHDLPETVSQRGGGSSFRPLPALGEERTRQLNTRWLEMSYDPLFLAFFVDLENCSICERYYESRGDAEGVDAVMRMKQAAGKSADAKSLHRRFFRVGRLRRRLMKLEETQTGPARNLLRLLSK